MSPAKISGNTPALYNGFLLYPQALRLPGNKWQAVVIIKRDGGNGDDAGTRASPPLHTLFNSEAEAREYALRYGQMLVSDGERIVCGEPPVGKSESGSLGETDLSPDEIECLVAIRRRLPIQGKLLDAHGSRLLAQGFIALDNGWPALTPSAVKTLDRIAFALTAASREVSQGDMARRNSSQGSSE